MVVIKMNLGQNIAKIRISKGVTQTFVTKSIGKSPQWLSNIEKGRRAIGADELHQIAEVLGVDVGIFFDQRVNEACNSTPTPANGTEGQS